MRPKIKFCGLKTIDDIKAVNILKPDFAGFVFHKPSIRFIELQDAIKLVENLDNSILKVAVFVDYPEDYKKYLANFDFIQSKNSPGIKTIPIDELSQNVDINDSKYFLIDKRAFGGSGENWEYSTVERFNLDKNKMFLAGGINIDNIDEAINVFPFCIDVSSSIEDENGNKDFTKMKQIIEKIRAV